VIIDASALLAAVLGEADGERYLDATPAPDQRVMSVANWLEATIATGFRGDVVASSQFEEFAQMAAIRPQPISVEQAFVAHPAWRSCGRGKHRAALNFGDCFAWAPAQVRHALLLFKGNDFPQTDIDLH
jgi:ribonuclease VapC